MKIIRTETSLLDFGKELHSYKEESDQVRVLTKVYIFGILVHTNIQFVSYEYHRPFECGGMINWGIEVPKPQAIMVKMD